MVEELLRLLRFMRMKLFFEEKIYAKSRKSGRSPSTETSTYSRDFATPSHASAISSNSESN